MTGFIADRTSIDGSAHLLIEIAGLLRQGCLDRDIGTLARAPHAHREIGASVDKFARFADNQYWDLVLLLTALSTKLKETGKKYVEADTKTQAELNKVLASGQYVAPEEK